MDWLLFAQILAQYGLPVAERIFQHWQSGEQVNQADIDRLKELGRNTAESQMREALALAGVDPSSDQGKAFLNLVRPKNVVTAPTQPIPAPAVPTLGA